MFKTICLLVMTCWACLAQANTETLRLIIKYKHQPLSIASLKSDITNTIHQPIKELKPLANGAYSLVVNPNKAILDQLHNDPKILYAVEDRVGYFKPVPKPATALINDNELLNHASQWDEFDSPAGIVLESGPGFNDGAWEYTRGASNPPVVVAVLDTGIALNENIVNSLLKDEQGQVYGWNFSGNNNKLNDETKSYHGTHVSGTIAGYGSVIQGVGPDLKILTLKIPKKSGMFYESTVINAIYWSVGASVPGVPDNHYPAKVLNMSFGIDSFDGDEVADCDEALQEAVSYARAQGAVVAVAAGNDDKLEGLSAPAVCKGSLKIAATGPEGFRSYFSNYGPSISFAAPGGDMNYGIHGGILSTVNPGGGFQGSGFDFFQGTSMATPHVAGLAGLIFAASPQVLTGNQVEQILYTTTHDFGLSSKTNKSCIGKKTCGHGIIDAENAVKAVHTGYSVYVSAPEFTTLGAETCSKGKYKPSQSKVISEQAVWTLAKSACQFQKNYSHPYTSEAVDGTITAYFGAVRYTLEQAGRVCHVIGYDGVGCI